MKFRKKINALENFRWKRTSQSYSLKCLFFSLANDDEGNEEVRERKMHT